MALTFKEIRRLFQAPTRGRVRLKFFLNVSKQEQRNLALLTAVFRA